jgi:hypothetical protein
MNSLRADSAISVVTPYRRAASSYSNDFAQIFGTERAANRGQSGPDPPLPTASYRVGTPNPLASPTRRPGTTSSTAKSDPTRSKSQSLRDAPSQSVRDVGPADALALIHVARWKGVPQRVALLSLR